MRKKIFFVVGLLCGIFFGLVGLTIVERMQTDNCTHFVLITKFACDKKIISKSEYAQLKSTLKLFISQKVDAGTLLSAGVYFRDLENGPTMGINEYEEFSTASLFKIPTLIAYLHLAESDPTILSHELRLDDGASTQNQFNQHYPPSENIEEGTPYTIDELLKRLAVYSDNISTEMLNMYLRSLTNDRDILNDTYKELGLVPDATSTDFSLSVKRYSSIYRILYSASYLSPEMSEKALELLTQSAFKDGLVAGVPSHIQVAHKFGERTTPASETSPTEIKQLHDCGIIYFPENPYLLCVMTRGNDFKQLESVIAEISEIVYKEIESRKI